VSNEQNNPIDMDDYIRRLNLSHALRKSVIRAAIHTIQFAPGSQGLDIGCGAGNITTLLAESVTPTGNVTGVDIAPEMVTYATDVAEKAGLSKQLSYREGDMNNLPFNDNTFDWTWSVDCVGYAPVEPLPLIKELMRVVKPGGRITFMAWSSQQLLPGYPDFEAQLNATSAGIAPFLKGKDSGKHFYRALGWFNQLGLESPKAQTFVGTAHAPLSDDVREALLSLIQMRWPGVQSELHQDDWEKFQRLCQPDSPDFILNLSDYYAFFTYSMFECKVPAH
jgi:demethylmenaquinone methyltransferase/2-methoxy-6-polyprenyl-1,4-benzoquinol methylase